MAHAAVYVAAAVVIGIAALIGFISATNKPQPMSHGRGGSRRRSPSPPSSPIPMPPPTRRRRRSPQRRPNSPARASTSTSTQRVTCTSCGESPYISVRPCNHESMCKGCFENYLKNNDTCPDCKGRIDSCSPLIPPFGKCRNCRKFTKLFKFLPCNHSLSLCISCFEEQNRSYKKCPECDQKIEGSEPRYTTSGICGICGEFTRFAKFQPCGHGNFCRRHATQYLENSGQVCSECGRRVTEIA